jgi:hypothetical protein
MSVNAIIWWSSLVAVLAVLALAGAQLARALRELNRLKARVAGYGELPVFKAVARAEADAQRLEGAVADVAPLIARAQAALAVIRRGPVPPELVTAAKRLGAEITALRRFGAELRSP